MQVLATPYNRACSALPGASRRKRMSTCPQCGAKVSFATHTCGACGAHVPAHGVVSTLFTHIPHPHIAARKERTPLKRRDLLPNANALQRFNSFLAVKITSAVGTMWCAYL